MTHTRGSRWLLGIVAVSAIGAALISLATQSDLLRGASAVAPITLSIDADVTDGTRPCDPVTDSVTLSPATTTHVVGLCYESHPVGLDAFDLTGR